MKAKHFVSQSVAVDQFCAVKLADLTYTEGSSRPDDCGSLWVAPIVWAAWGAPLGILALYATTNGDPILLGQIEDGEVLWDRDALANICDALISSDWVHRPDGEGYSYLVMDSIGEREVEDEAEDAISPA